MSATAVHHRNGEHEEPAVTESEPSRGRVVEASRYRLVEPQELRGRFGSTFSRAWLWHMSRENAFPQPVRIGSQRIAYIEQEVIDWIKSLPRRNVGMSQSQKVAREKSLPLARAKSLQKRRRMRGARKE